MAVPPLVALKAATSAQKALTGDIYTRTTSRVVGKGKKAVVVDATVHVNPVGIGLGAAALAAAAVGVGVAAWVLQLKLKPTIVKTYRTVIDTPAAPGGWVSDPGTGHWSVSGNTGDYKGPGGWQPGDVWIVDTLPSRYWIPEIPAVTHQEETGTTKKFSIEQRRGFSAGDVLESVTDAVGLGAPLAASRVIPKIVMDPLHVFKGKWWP